MYITHGKTIHSCRDNQAQKSSIARPSWPSLAHMQILIAEADVSWPAKFQHNITAGAHCHQVPACPIRSKENTCPSRVEPFLHKLKFHHFSCDIKLKWHDRKLGSFNQLSLHFSPTHSVKNQEQPWSGH